MEKHQEIQELTLEEVMGDRFGRYSKYIIQERALPDIRDGLKPVQRRILFSMNKDGNTFDKNFRKSAKSVGNIMGNYHPHGDSSIYEAMVRLSQDWKLREVLIEMHGNNGSMDGDPPAAMRYTEARLSELSGELLKDIEKETVDFVWNFDDTEKEPTVLPAKYPNLLVNGSTGISAGYATEIPTHNLAEIIDGTIYLIDHPNASLEKLMEFIPGPDFPTGAILQGKEEISKAYATGRGKVILRSKTKIEPLKGGKQQILVTEIPYEVNKATLVKKIDEIRLNKKIDGISEVRDESDRTGLQIAIELKKEANAQGILHYLLKNTELQINYNFNMVAIDNMTPQQVGLKRILTSYITHRKEVVTNRSRFELTKAQTRQHIVAGLIKALSILDQVIETIRGSKDKKDAKQNLITEYAFTQEQAEAIVTLQLYRLTNTDITQLQQEADALNQAIAELNLILNDERQLLTLIKKELREVKKKYATDRLTKIEDKIEEIKIETEMLIAQEDVRVTVTHEGYIKRSSLRSYNASKPEELAMKDGDHLLYSQEVNTRDHLLLITNKANVIYRPVHELPDLKWKEMGEHISQTVLNLAIDESILTVYVFKQFSAKQNFVFMTKEGMIKQTIMNDFQPWRTYKSRPTSCMKLKSTTDELVQTFLVSQSSEADIVLISHRGFGLRYPLKEVPVVGSKAAGVKSMNLKEQDYIVSGLLVETDGKIPIVVLTQRGSLKKMLLNELTRLGRAKRGLMILRELKKNPHRIVFASKVQPNEKLMILTQKGTTHLIEPQNYPLNERTSNGSFVYDEKEEGSIERIYLLN